MTSPETTDAGAARRGLAIIRWRDRKTGMEKSEVVDVTWNGGEAMIPLRVYDPKAPPTIELQVTR